MKLKQLTYFVLLCFCCCSVRAQDLPLKGKKIAIDPGHTAGNMEQAFIEKKYLKFALDSINISKGLKDSIEIIEPQSTLATALLLKKELELQGAEVLLTRTKPGYSSFDKTFKKWYVEAYAKRKRKPKERWAFVNDFNTKDIENRARIVNRYKPDATIIIHYNVDEKNEPWTSPTTKNYNMVFVAPSEEKLDSLRAQLNPLAVKSNYAQSVCLASELLKSFDKILQVPTASEEDACYLQDKCKRTVSPGVFERNLALNRLIKGVVVYGETLYQDNINECQLLNEKTLEIDGVKYSPRVKQVADAYFEGIMNYYKKCNAPNN